MAAAYLATGVRRTTYARIQGKMQGNRPDPLRLPSSQGSRRVALFTREHWNLE